MARALLTDDPKKPSKTTTTNTNTTTPTRKLSDVETTSTPQYMSQYYKFWMQPPEGMIVGKALDVFCFGHILRESLTGNGKKKKKNSINL